MVICTLFFNHPALYVVLGFFTSVLAIALSVGICDKFLTVLVLCACFSISGFSQEKTPLEKFEELIPRLYHIELQDTFYSVQKINHWHKQMVCFSHEPHIFLTYAEIAGNVEATLTIDSTSFTANFMLNENDNEQFAVSTKNTRLYFLSKDAAEERMFSNCLLLQLNVKKISGEVIRRGYLKPVATKVERMYSGNLLCRYENKEGEPIFVLQLYKDSDKATLRLLKPYDQTIELIRGGKAGMQLQAFEMGRKKVELFFFEDFN